MAQGDPWAGFGESKGEDPWAGFGGGAVTAAPPDTSGFEIKPEGIPDVEQPAAPEAPDLTPKLGDVTGGFLRSQLKQDVVDKLGARAARSIIQTGAHLTGTIGGLGERALNLLHPGDLTQAEMRRREQRAADTGKGVEEWAKNALPAPTTIPERLVEGAAPIAAIGLSGPLAAPAMVGMGADYIQQARDRAIKAGATPEEADLVMGENVPAAILSLAPPGGASALAGLAEKSPGMLKFLVETVQHAAAGTLGQNTAQAVTQMAQNSVKPEDKSAFQAFAENLGEHFGVNLLGVGAAGASNLRGKAEAPPETKAPPATEGAAASGLPERIPSGSGQGTVPQEQAAGGPEEINLGDRRAVERQGQPERRKTPRPTVEQTNQEAALRAYQKLSQGDAVGALAEMQSAAEAQGAARKADALTGLGNAQAFEESPREGRTETSADMDGLGYMNKLGHAFGDEALKKVGDAYKAEIDAYNATAPPEKRVDAFHPHGDEFALHGPSPEVNEQIQQGVNERLKGESVTGRIEDREDPNFGKTVTIKGLGLSWGHGEPGTGEVGAKDYYSPEAEKNLLAHKAEREAAGERAKKGQAPVGAVFEEPAALEVANSVEPGAAAETSPIRPAAAEPLPQEAAAPTPPPPPEGEAGGEPRGVYQKPSTNPRFPGMTEAQARYLSNAWPGYEAPLSEQVKGPLYHETSLAGARALLQRTEGKTAVSHTGLATSDNPDLALGQGGRGVRLEFDSSKAVGAENKSKPGLAYTKETGGGSEYNVSASVRGIVRAIEVKSKMTLAALKRALGDRFDFDNAQKTEYGWRVERKTAEPKGEAESPGLFKKPPESKQAGALDLFGGRKPPPPAKDVREPDSEGYQHIDEYLANKQLAEQTIDRNAITYKQRIRDAGEDVDLAGRALDPYAALKIKGEAAYDAMSKVVPENERDAYEYAKTAPPEVKAVWDQMLKDKEALGAHGEANIPDFQRRENYTMQAWKPLEGEKGSAGTGRPKFGLSTPREESRTFPTVLEGWAAGRERAMPDGFANYVRSGKQLTSSIEARRLLDTLKKSEIAGTEPQPGWKRIESSKLFDSAEFRTPEGETVKLSLPTYAEPKTADALNKIIATSKLQGIGPVETMKRLNNAYRASIFYTGLFHPRQFIVREILSSPTLFKNPFREYRRGLDAIQKWDDQTQLLVKGGLRLFNPQDFTPALDAEKSRFEKAVDAIPGGTQAKEALKSFGDTVRRFTFERLGAAYKLMGAKAELSAWQTRHADELRQGTLTLEDGAKAVAAAHNDLWGGQNWERILLDEKGLTSKLADPTMKDLVGLALNTPDWTTSKLRLFVKAFERGDGADVRRLMWGRTIGRAAAATIGANVMMSLFDDKDALDRYKEAWKQNPLHLADVDWTPLHDAVFGKDKDSKMRHYFGVVGALAEPLSWMIASDKEGKHFDPIKGPLQHLRYRESLMGKLVNDALEGSDPIGRAFTGTGEMTGIEDRGRYKSSGPGRYKGMKKESLAGQFNSYKSKYQDKAGPVNFDELPSFVMGETLGAMPVQLQAAYAKMLGQLDWSQAVGRSLGLDISQAAPREPKKSKTR